jgi:hypothetical protein
MTPKPDNQRQIIRQSQLKLALDYFNACGICPTMTDLIRITTMLEEFVVGGYSKDIVSKFEKIDAFIKDEYKKG